MKHTRRDVIAAMIGGAAATGAVRMALADSASQLPAASVGGQLSGAIGPSDAMQTLTSERPVAMIIADAEVDAEVEINHIVEGQMLDPTGAWVVSWYEGTGMLHEKRRNMLYSGHVDYWGVGPSVFRNLANVPEGGLIQVLGDKGGEAFYAVEFVERVTLAEMTPEKMQQITAPTPYEALTIITCGGEFDYDLGEYLQRDVVRGRLVSGKEVGTRVTDQPVDNEAAEPESDATAAAEEAPKTATVTQDNVNVRPSASTSGAAVTSLSAGTVVTIDGDAVEAEGYTWYPVKLEDGSTGFVVADFLELVP